ncbi:MAG: NAD(P)-dependent oxidoreductase [Alphaproteobacteria bacterium]|nr:NAD(P)-dependent oxidoreductase [Alphaproteobacteria bacterium]
MGSAMAANLAMSGYRVLGYVRRADRSSALAASGIHPVTSLDELSACGVLISMLPDDAALVEVMVGPRQTGGLIRTLAAGAVHLSMSTVSPQCATDLAAEHARHGQGYVAAPVFGNPDAAKARELFIISAGAPDCIARCRSLLDALGQKTFVVGDVPAAANLVKLAGNVMSAATMEIMGEVLALARKSGLNPEQLLTILTSTLFGSRVHRIYGRKIVSQHYAPAGLVLPLALKDIRLALAEAEKAAVPMPSVSVVRDRLLAGIAKGYAHLDWSALGLIAAEEAGLNQKR